MSSRFLFLSSNDAARTALCALTSLLAVACLGPLPCHETGTCAPAPQEDAAVQVEAGTPGGQPNEDSGTIGPSSTEPNGEAGARSEAGSGGMGGVGGRGGSSGRGGTGGSAGAFERPEDAGPEDVDASMDAGGEANDGGVGGNAQDAGFAGMTGEGGSGGALPEPCIVSADCPDPTAAHCDYEGNCIGCVEMADCLHFDDTPLCRQDDGQCVACLGVEDCTVGSPVCSEAGQCEGCTMHDDCAGFADTPLCEESTGSCVECTEHADCDDPTAAQCDPVTNTCVTCVEDEHCLGIAGSEVCDAAAGECVECTGLKDEACTVGVNEYVCDSLLRTCAEPVEANEVGMAGNCDPCLSDAHCEAGRLCVMQEFDDVEIGYFCFWEEGNVEQGAPANCAPDGRPYVDQLVQVDSIDGVEDATICGLSVATCPALNDYRSRDCDPEAPIADQCGFPGVEDGLCRPFGATNFCTTRCGSDFDCQFGFDCDGTPLFCQF